MTLPLCLDLFCGTGSGSGEGVSVTPTPPTPGPWNTHEAPIGLYLSDRFQSSVETTTDSYLLAIVLGDSQEEADANARLIASVPDLLRKRDELLEKLAFVKGERDALHNKAEALRVALLAVERVQLAKAVLSESQAEEGT